MASLPSKELIFKIHCYFYGTHGNKEVCTTGFGGMQDEPFLTSWIQNVRFLAIGIRNGQGKLDRDLRVFCCSGKGIC